MIDPANLHLLFHVVPIETFNTLYMVTVSTFFSFVIGLFLAIILYISDKEGLKEDRALYQTLSTIVNIGRSIPFAILMIAIIPFTRLVVGTSIGTTASIVPLTVTGLFFMARFLESYFKEVNKEIIVTAQVMGSSVQQIVKKVVLPESLPGIIKALKITAVNLVGFSTMAGLIGGGGLGKVAVQYGYQRFNGFIVVVTLVLILLLVEGIEWLGNFLVKKILRKRGLV